MSGGEPCGALGRLIDGVSLSNTEGVDNSASLGDSEGTSESTTDSLLNSSAKCDMSNRSVDRDIEFWCRSQGVSLMLLESYKVHSMMMLNILVKLMVYMR